MIETRKKRLKIALKLSSKQLIMNHLLFSFFRNCLRRLIHDDKEFSNQSIINVIERFVKSVNLMEETILIPSRLMDRQVRKKFVLIILSIFTRVTL